MRVIGLVSLAPPPLGNEIGVRGAEKKKEKTMSGEGVWGDDLGAEWTYGEG